MPCEATARVRPCDRRNTAALTDLVVVLNAAWTARELRELIPHDPVTQRSVDVVYGVFDPRDFLVSVDSRPRFGEEEDDTFASPPRDLKDLRELAVRLVAECATLYRCKIFEYHTIINIL